MSGIFVSPAELPEGAEDLGLVSASCVMGTGLVAEIASFFTDLFGKKSGVYHKKWIWPRKTPLGR